MVLKYETHCQSIKSATCGSISNMVRTLVLYSHAIEIIYSWVYAFYFIEYWNETVYSFVIDCTQIDYFTHARTFGMIFLMFISCNQVALWMLQSVCQSDWPTKRRPVATLVHKFGCFVPVWLSGFVWLHSYIQTHKTVSCDYFCP